MRSLLSTICASVMVAGCAEARPENEELITSAEGDPLVAVATAQARETLPIFWRLHAAQPDGYSDFALKVGFSTSSGGREHIWVVDVVREADGGRGHLGNNPNDLGRLRAGSPVSFKDDQINDWQYEKGGKFYGHFTSRAMMDRWNAAQRAEGLALFAPEPLEAGVQ